MSKPRLLIILLAIWIIISNGLVLFAWKATNLFDVVMEERISPLLCIQREYEYKTPYSKVENPNVSEIDWAIYQRVGKELMEETGCPKYEDFVWFNLTEESIRSTFEDAIKE